MIVYLPNGGSVILHGSGYIVYGTNPQNYRVKRKYEGKEKEDIALDIVQGMVIIYNDMPHTYIPPPEKKVPKDADEAMNLIDLSKLSPQVIATVRNKLNTYSVKLKKWRK